MYSYFYILFPFYNLEKEIAKYWIHISSILCSLILSLYKR